MEDRSYLEAEAALVSCIAASPQDAGEALAKLTPDDFFTPEAAALFSAEKALLAEGKLLDAPLLANRCPDCREYLIQALELYSFTANLPEYTRLVCDASMRRKVQQLASQLHSDAISGAPIDELMGSADKLQKLLTGNPQEGAVDFFTGIQAFSVRQQRKRVDYIKTGIQRLDAGIYIEPGDYCVIGARPSAGKTALALQVALEVSRSRRVVFFSLETRAEKIYDRLASTWLGIDFGAIKKFTVGDHEFDQLDAELPKLEHDLFVVNAAGWDVPRLAAKARAMKAEVIFVDYLGLLKSSARTRYEAVTDISIQLHTFAQSSKICVFALSQLNRGDGNDETPPSLRDLRESGQVEQDADLVLLLHGQDERREIRVAKNKEGRAGVKLSFIFDGDHQLFVGV